jgi:single-strand DNA-binding protein
MSLNKVMLIGNAGKDPEVRYLGGSSAADQNAKVATFTLATSERYRDRNSGELREQTEWHNIVAWRGLADRVERFVKKGTQLYVEGHLRTRQWTDQSNQTRYTTEVVADQIQLLGRRQDNPGGQRETSGQQQYQAGGQGGFNGGFKANQGQPSTQIPPKQPEPQAPQGGPEEPADDLPF